jgi:hypothetical protein
MLKKVRYRQGLLRVVLVAALALAGIVVAGTCCFGPRLFRYGSSAASPVGDQANTPGPDVFNGHKVMLDGQNKILPWAPQSLVRAPNPSAAPVPLTIAYDHFLRLRWEFIKTKVPNCPGPPPRSSYPAYYFYCAFWDKNGVLEPDTWMNDVAEKIPNWFESARLY